MDKNKEAPFLEVVYNGEKIPLSSEEVITLAQKGMNYDKLFEKSEKTKKELEKMKEANKKLEKIAEELKVSPEDMLNELEQERERVDIFEYSKENNIPYEYAKMLKDMESEIKALRREKEELIPIKKRNEEISEFKKAHPDVDERNLDPEILKVWEESKRPLKDVYNEITLKKLLSEKNIKKANEENLLASSGSALGVPEREEEYTDQMIREMSDKDFNRNFAKILKQYKKGER